MKERILLSPEARVNDGLHGRNFYHAGVGFGSVREGYAGEDFCTVVAFDDLEGVSRTDRENVVLGDEENAQRIVREAIAVVMSNPFEEFTPGLSSEPVYRQPETAYPSREDVQDQTWAGQPNSAS